MDLKQLEGTTCVDIQTTPSVDACFYDKEVASGVRLLCNVLAWGLRSFWCKKIHFSLFGT